MRNYLKVLSIVLCISIGYAQKQKDEPLTYKDDFSLNWEKNDSNLLLVARNKLLTPIQINFFSRKDSIKLKSFLLRSRDSLILFKKILSEKDSVFTTIFFDSIRIGYVFGHKSLINPDYDYKYRLPFKQGKRYEVSQSFNGKKSHYKDSSKYAIDFQLNVGEPVYSAREGTVIKVIDWFSKGGGKEFINSANKIIVEHPDGTYGNYVHLKYKGSIVKEGEKINKGQMIGFSGLTGYTNGPHLHFVVRKENDISIPIYFKGYDGQVLKKGKKYKAVN